MDHHVPPGTPQSDSDYASRTAGGSREWNLAECIRTLRRHQTPLLWIAGTGIAATLLFSMMQTRIYQSQASVQVQGVNENFLSLRDIFPMSAPSADNAVYVATQAEMLRQDSLLEQVVRKLRLDERPEFQSEGGIRDLFRRSGAISPSAAAVEKLRAAVQIVPTRGSSIIQIAADSRDPQLAADIANTLAESFIEQNIEARQQAAEETRVSLVQQLGELRRRLLHSEAGLEASDRRSAATPGALKREVEANRQFYAAISRRIDEAAIASRVRQSNVRLVGPAQPAAHPYRPNLLLNLVLGMFGCLGLAIGYLMLREQTNSALRAPGDAAAYLTIPELGAIPRAGKRTLLALRLPGTSNGTPPVERASLEQAGTGVSESFRSTLASILATSHNGDHPRVLVITSSRPGEGKTTVVSNLGIALSKIGSRVLVIDGDLRRPRLHTVFDEVNSWGLSDILREKNAVEELPLEALIKRTAVPHLHLLPSGTSTDNIFELLCSGRMSRLLARFRQEFDYVLVDAPPCLEFADARIMARYAEKLLLVVRADYTERETAQAAVERLRLDGIPVMGVILNCWDSTNGIFSRTRYAQEPS